MKSALIISVLILVMMSGMAASDVQENWPMGTPNTHQDPHILIDFENGTSWDIITSSTNKITFENGDGNPWIYGCNNGEFNIYDPVNCPYCKYVINGDCAAWCGIPGHYGNISFKHDVGHVSVLVSTCSGLQMDAYNENGVQVATSGWADGNLFYQLPGAEPVLTRISVDRPVECDISYVCIHDTGDFWCIDDLLITRKRGEGGIAHCQSFIHGQGQGQVPDHVTDRWDPCNTTV